MPKSAVESAIHCHECHQKVQVPELAHKDKALCPRCGLVLTVFRERAHHHLASFALAALVFLLMALPFDFLAFSAKGQGHVINIPDSIWLMVSNGYSLLALLLLLAIVLLPALLLLALLGLLLSEFWQLTLPTKRRLLNTIFALLPWTMAEIFIIGVLVSLIKIVALADIRIGISLYAYIGFTLCFVVTLSQLDRHQLEQRFDIPKAPHPIMPFSIQRTWALLLTAVILYIPANILPIMSTRLLGRDEPSTILGGVIHLWQGGSYPIAIVIFIASVAVPVAKLIILSWLNYSVQRAHQHAQLQRIKWYRVTEFVGRWSMVDVFVVAILVSLIQLGNTMSIYPGPAALAFSAVVILTMLAAMSFDSRLIWNPRK